MVRVFNNLEEMKRYYDEETDSYIFKENGKFIDEIIINFDLNVESDIVANNVRATNITANYIEAWNITVWDIKACDINSGNINAGMIQARDIRALDIKSMNIYARDIDAYSVDAVNIYARDIIYSETCRAYEDFKCNSIKCKRSTPIQFSFSIYGKIEVTEDD